MATLLFPGRHILNTRFQEQYLLANLHRPIELLPLLIGAARPAGEIDRVVFAVTSANQSHSRYNPVPLEVRAVALDRFARRLSDAIIVEYRLIPIPHFAPTAKFAGHLLKEICEGTEDRLDLTPDDTVVLSSTPTVVRQFLGLGFSVLPAELEIPAGQANSVAAYFALDVPPGYLAPTPADVLKQIATAGDAWADDPLVRSNLSPATLGCWHDFPDVPRRVLRLFRDPLLTEQGSLTEMRNYSVYAQGMNERACLRLKYDDIKAAIVPGKIADEGCADGALLVPIAEDFPDSDLVGIEITGEFLARCLERQRALEYGGTYIHFHQRNITEPIFEPNSIDTTICNSTTHELWSYGNQATTLRAYLREKYRQTRRGGRILIRDVVGPADKEREVYLSCNDADGLKPSERHPPEAEMCLLASMMLDKNVISEIITIVERNAFDQARHRVVFDALTRLHAANGPVDAVIVREELARRGELEEIGGTAYLATILNSVPSAADGRRYAEIVGDVFRGSPFRAFASSDDLADHLAKLSTAARFRRFAKDFLADLRAAGRRDASTELRFREETIDGKTYFVLRLRHAVEFMTKKDYTANWRSEMNEEFAFWDFTEWKREFADAGFIVIENPTDPDRSSRAYVNDWIVKNRWEGKVELLERHSDGTFAHLDWPVTNMVLIGEKQ